MQNAGDTLKKWTNKELRYAENCG